MPPQIGQVFFAGLPVNQVDDECPHDRTPLFDRRRFDRRPLFPADFVRSSKWFRRLIQGAGPRP